MNSYFHDIYKKLFTLCKNTYNFSNLNYLKIISSSCLSILAWLIFKGMTRLFSSSQLSLKKTWTVLDLTLVHGSLAAFRELECRIFLSRSRKIYLPRAIHSRTPPFPSEWEAIPICFSRYWPRLNPIPSCNRVTPKISFDFLSF